MTNEMETAKRLYLESLRAMDKEIDGLLGFAIDFKGEMSSQRLMQAQELIRTEIKAA